MHTFLLIFLLLGVPLSTHAATFSIAVEPETLRTGGTALLYVSLSTDSSVVNAVEGVVRVPAPLQIQSIRYTGSYIPFWVEEPKEREPGLVSFSGIFTGGYVADSSASGNLFTIVVSGVREGDAVASFTSATHAYANDGEGTELPLALRGAKIVVSDSSEATSVEVVRDTTSPEAFSPEVVSGEVFGQSGTMLVFIAQDKNSAIARYELAHSILPFVTPFLSWKEVQSPYALSKNDLYGFTFLQAHDAEGNVTTASALPGGLLRAYAPLGVILGIVSILACALLWRGIIYRRR